MWVLSQHQIPYIILVGPNWNTTNATHVLLAKICGGKLKGQDSSPSLKGWCCRLSKVDLPIHPRNQAIQMGITGINENMVQSASPKIKISTLRLIISLLLFDLHNDWGRIEIAHFTLWRNQEFRVLFALFLLGHSLSMSQWSMLLLYSSYYFFPSHVLLMLLYIKKTKDHPK